MYPKALYLLAATTLILGACEPEVKIVSVEPSTISITSPTDETKLEAEAQDLRGNRIDGIPLNFRSTNTAVATVSEDGTITPVSSGTASIVASTDAGKQGEAMVKICLPKEIICDPINVLELRVGTAAPLRCHLINCNEEKLATAVSLKVTDEEAILKEGDKDFIGKKVGETKIIASGGGLEKEITVKIGEQIFAPGMEPGKGGGGRRSGAAPDRNKNPYNEGKGGQFDHILKNI